MTSGEVLKDAFGRVREGAHRLLDGLSPADLGLRPGPGSNPIGWLVWHLARVQDDHVAEVAGTGQVWTEKGWVGRFSLPYDKDATGYGQSAAEVGRFSVSSTDLLVGYLDQVHEATLGYLDGLDDADLERVVDDSYDPPVTLGVRLVSVIADDLQHLGQAAYVKGLAKRQ